MNPRKNQSLMLGTFLIVLGVVALFGLWNLLLPGILAVAGYVVYSQRRRASRTVEAVQGGLWCVGLALLFALNIFWPGILFLAGLSVLARGREFEVDNQVQSVLGRAQARTARRATPSQNVPITVAPQHTPVRPDLSATTREGEATTGDTQRLS